MSEASNEFPSRDQIEALQLAKIQQLIALTIPNNRFYTNKLQNCQLAGGFRSLEEFRAVIPFTRRRELTLDQEANPPYGTNLTFPLEKYVRMHQTSGTSGTPMRWLDTQKSWQWMEDNWLHVFRSAEITASDRLFFPFSFGPFVAFWAAFGAANKLGCLSIPGGGLGSSARLQTMLDNAITVLCCTPTYALHLAEIAARESIDMSACPLRLIVVGGEPGGSIESTRNQIESRWHGARVVDHHGMTEIGPVSYECRLRPGVLHVTESDFYPEVVLPHTSEAAADGEDGELVLTNLGRTGSPLLRYRTGDLVRPETCNPCACGSHELALLGGVLGRVDDMIIVRGINLFPSAVEQIVRSFPEVVEYQVEIREGESLKDVKILVEVAPDCDRPDHVTRQLEATLQSRLSLRIPVSLAPADRLPRFELKAQRWMRL